MVRAVLLVFLITSLLYTPSYVQGGHMIHDFYKCKSEYFRKILRRCKEAENGNRDTRRGRLYNAGDPVLLLPSLFALTLARTLLT